MDSPKTNGIKFHHVWLFCKPDFLQIIVNVANNQTYPKR